MTCKFEGRQVGSHETFNVHWCDKLQKTCVPREDLLQLMPGSTAVGCDTCCDRVEADVVEGCCDVPAWMVCSKRLFPTGQSMNCQCNVDRTIYGCSVNGLCVKKLPPGKTLETPGLFGDLAGRVVVCSDCNDAEAK